ncbi:recombinase family protein [Hymenobacter latericus]|uniref:hypothetical protein n=1 Tax=Hymenobacter sp. YIM 151858-1 TaxID=2987688 RepID=UPI0039B4DA0C
MNRLGRNSAHIMQAVADLHARQVRFAPPHVGTNTAKPAGCGHLRCAGRARPRKHP